MTRTLYICYFGLREPLVQTQVLPYLRQIVRDGIEVSLLTFEPDLGRAWLAQEKADWNDRMERDGILEASLDRLVIEAHSLGVPLEELGSKLTRRIDLFKRQRKAAARQAAVNPLALGKGAR